MNLLSQLNSMLSQEIPSIATIVGSRGNGVWAGKTTGGGVVLLTGKESYAIGQKVYYNALSNHITSNAPDVDFRSYGV